MLWITFFVMAVAAVIFGTYPLFRQEKKPWRVMSASIVLIVGVAGGMYYWLGSPGTTSAVPATSLEEMVEGLAERLKDSPDDVEGWTMLARSYVELQRMPEAAQAYEHVIKLEKGSNSYTLADFGEVLWAMDRQQISGRAGALFDSALAIDSNNTKALFYGGLASANKGDSETAISRWESFLALTSGENVPANVLDFVRRSVAELKGVAFEPGPAEAVPTGEATGTYILANISVSAEAASAATSQATLWLIARDADNPGPPVAAVRRSAGQLPVELTISDQDAMMEGRDLSSLGRIELIARISASGQPGAAKGDWFGTTIVVPGHGTQVDIEINTQVE
jgi:cytochrome c-type biogenesis protein CcmH